jgi:hypothetical protein
VRREQETVFAKADATSYLLLSKPTNALFTSFRYMNLTGILRLRVYLTIVASIFVCFAFLPVMRSLITTAEWKSKNGHAALVCASEAFDLGISLLKRLNCRVLLYT